MPEPTLAADVLADLLNDLRAVGPLAKNEKSFAAAFEAYRAADAKTYQAVLRRLKLFPRCRYICDWVCSKECVLLCFELCGPPKLDQKLPDPRRFAEVVVKLTSDEKLVQRLAATIEKRDSAGYRRLIKELDLEPYCHLICRWVCAVRCRLVCRRFCDPVIVAGRPSLALELQIAGTALGRLLEQREWFDQAVVALEANDADTFRAALEPVGIRDRCHLICEWFCSWHCFRVCLPLCRAFPMVEIHEPITEALGFARASQVLLKQPALLAELVSAVERRDADRFTGIVKELKLERYCIQLCHWICHRHCRRFCRISCPPIDTIPLWTHVGAYRVDPLPNDFAADGTTTAGSLAFTGTIPLIGILPDGAAAEAVEYRFLYGKHPTLITPDVVDTTKVAATKIGQLEYWYWDTSTLTWKVSAADYWVNNPGAKATIPQSLGPPLTPLVNKDVKPGGWIEVPREDSLVPGGVGRFVPNGNLIALDTTKLTNEVFDLKVPAPGLAAGDSVPVVPPVPGDSHSEKPTFRFAFEARKVVSLVAIPGNGLEKIALSNTTYKYTLHPEWDGGPIERRSVCSLGIAELAAAACTEMGDHVHARYTAYHPYLGGVVVYLQGPGIPTIPGSPPGPAPTPSIFTFVPAVVADEAASGAAGHDFDLTTLQPCAYIAWMSVSLRLTNGFSVVSAEYDDLAFCKGTRPPGP